MYCPRILCQSCSWVRNILPPIHHLLVYLVTSWLTLSVSWPSLYPHPPAWSVGCSYTLHVTPSHRPIPSRQRDPPHRHLLSLSFYTQCINVFYICIRCISYNDVVSLGCGLDVSHHPLCLNSMFSVGTRVHAELQRRWWPSPSRWPVHELPVACVFLTVHTIYLSSSHHHLPVSVNCLSLCVSSLLFSDSLVSLSCLNDPPAQTHSHTNTL